MNRACKAVVETCHNFKNADVQLHERNVRLLSNCLQLGKQLEIFRQIADQLDDQRQTAQLDVLDILVLKLNYVDAKLKYFSENQSSKWARAKYVVQKSNLDKAINDIESWQRLSFNPLWLETMKVQTQQIDQPLRRAKESSPPQDSNIMAAAIAIRNPLKDVNTARVFLPATKLESAEILDIEYSSVKYVNIDNKWRVLDSVSYLQRDAVRELAVRLKRADPSTFGLLTCLGAVQDERDHTCSLVFRIPESISMPVTLRAKIMSTDTTHSLSDRFRLATQLARAVFSIHTFDMVHKSIQPENIILFDDPTSTLGSAYLFGFEKIRLDTGDTVMAGDTDWTKNLYRHPQRQGPRIQERYVMQHDIYSLGVCLLEIGLWSSFVNYVPGGDFQPFKSQAYPMIYGDDYYTPRGSEATKGHLLALAVYELPKTMGSKYAAIVESCLTCLDLGNEDFGDEDELQRDGETVAVRYIQKVLMQLSGISV
ncbi:hypothetical protein BU24DRAFT_123764 [Aaosphaeria arxii CBS 175.79]|uniref:Protein kinase domain-containing protein n=1 Tax=Aaosphaeria arxii CBS 175.79 TaxID=1450172 RepID=A0A6A5Y510_9PLEO|nr:uncharacterized protein BU24DRAFT_123764 [Aaosphaeria arxii CBS 175.79]KAF2019614.1 hypothetical protein BU24DRAFT_123764 [Aaosphaeria arxii CBS 175.79]